MCLETNMKKTTLNSIIGNVALANRINRENYRKHSVEYSCALCDLHCARLKLSSQETARVKKNVHIKKKRHFHFYLGKKIGGTME